MLQYQAAVLSFWLHLLVFQTRAQITDATCAAGLQWMSNSKNQNPCLIAAYLEGACLPGGEWQVSALPPNSNTTYQAHSLQQATPCTCSSVSFSLLSACAYCQGCNLIDWGDWLANCPANLVSNGQYPHEIPSGTSVPAWAYQVVIVTLNVTEAESVAEEHLPESVAPGASSTSSTSSTTSSIAATSSTNSGDSSTSSASASSTTSGTGTNTATATGKSSGHTGAIAGGVVGGVAAVVIALLGAFFLYRRSQRKRHTLPITTPTQYDSPDAPLTGPVSPQSSTMPYASTPGTLTPATPQMKFYNPNDPSTFPASGFFGNAPPDTGATTNAITSFPPSPPPGAGSGLIMVH